MLQKLTIREIAQNNPSIDLQKLEEWKNLAKFPRQRGLCGMKRKSTSAGQDSRAKIIDDLESDPRLVRLQR